MWELNNIENEINVDGFKKIAEPAVEYILGAVETPRAELEIDNFVEAYIKILLFGWLGANLDGYPTGVVNWLVQIFNVDYEGIDSTTLNYLQGKAPEDIPADYAKNRASQIIDPMISAFFNYVVITNAAIQNKRTVGGITMRDSRVRPKHALHDSKFWDSNSYQPWYDINCRCIYTFFTSATEAINAGYTPLQGIPRSVQKDKLDEVFKKYKEATNMGYQEFVDWSRTDCSKKASLDRSPIERNSHLLKTQKVNWGSKEIAWANKTIGFIARMKQNLGGKNEVEGCGTKAHISLKNWAYDSKK